jgi:hypothetical protein
VPPPPPALVVPPPPPSAAVAANHFRHHAARPPLPPSPRPADGHRPLRVLPRPGRQRSYAASPSAGRTATTVGPPLPPTSSSRVGDYGATLTLATRNPKHPPSRPSPRPPLATPPTSHPSPVAAPPPPLTRRQPLQPLPSPSHSSPAAAPPSAIKSHAVALYNE